MRSKTKFHLDTVHCRKAEIEKSVVNNLVNIITMLNITPLKKVISALVHWF